MANALIIDDSRQLADTLKKILSLLGIEARAAYGSRAAFEALQEFTPRFITVDLNMPGLGGFDVIDYLQREPRLENIPVIIITSDDQPETRSRAKEMGAAGFVVKPVEIDELESALENAGIISR